MTPARLEPAALRSKTIIEMKQTADDKQYKPHLKIVAHDHCAIVLRLPQDERPMSIRFYEPCMGSVWGPCVYLTIITRVYDHFGAK